MKLRNVANRSTQVDLIVICATWLLIVLALWVLQHLGYPVGYRVWPSGEDRNWVSFLQTGSGSAAAQAFWQMNDRNPLSPWWYIAVREIILGWDGGLLLVAYAIRLPLALGIYLCTKSVAGRTGRGFSLGVACLAATVSFNGYIDNIIWNFVGALSLTFFSIYAYTRFADSSERSRNWYALSLVLWFFAFASYTLQSGAVLAIGFLAFSAPVGGQGLAERTWLRTVRTVSHTWPYVALYAAFLMIWRTTANPQMAVYYQTTFSFRQLLTSVHMGLWHVDYGMFFSWLLHGPFQESERFLTGAAIFAASFLLLTVGQFAGRKDPGSAQPIRLYALLRVMVVALCVVLPTLLIEASSSVWMPGMRWRMLHPFWIPFSIMVVFAGAALAISAFRTWRTPAQDRQLERFAWNGAIAASVAGLFLIDLGHNQIQVAETRREMAVKSAIARVIDEPGPSGKSQISHFLVQTTSSAAWTSADAMSQMYISTWFPGRNLTMRIIPSGPPSDPGWAPWWRVKFGSDDAGVGNIEVGGGQAPYRTIQVLKLDEGGHVTPLLGPDRDVFKGLEVDWDRIAPVPVSAANLACGAVWNAAEPQSGTGFGETEKDGHGPFRWTVASTASVSVQPCPGPMDVTIRIAFAVTEDNIDRLRVQLDGKPLATSQSRDPTGILLTAHVDKGDLPAGKTVELSLSVPKLDTVAGSSRTFGVAVRSIRASPTSRPLEAQQAL